MKKAALLWIAFAPFLALAACSSTDDGVDKIKAGDKPEKAKIKEINTDNLICPQVAILREAQKVYDFAGENPDPAQFVALAQMKSVEGDCGYKEGGIDISFKIHMSSTRGKRLGGGQIDFPYFVAIIDPAENIVRRQVVTAHFQFEGSDRNADHDEALHVFVPVAKENIQSGPDYRVLVAFKLPANQMPKPNSGN
jgi:hypothetical protein